MFTPVSAYVISTTLGVKNLAMTTIFKHLSEILADTFPCESKINVDTKYNLLIKGYNFL